MWRVMGLVLLAGVVLAGIYPQQARLGAQVLGNGLRAPSVPEAAPWGAMGPEAGALVRAAEAQVGVTLSYDPAYVQLSYPGGDVPRDRGVCTDVLIRALRDGLGIDLQQAVHEDMRAAFAKYPKRWGLKKTDRNIDHRRVPNLEVFLTRAGAALPVSAEARDYSAGDIVTALFPDGQTHVMIVTNRSSGDGLRPLIVHNVGAGARVEDRLFEWQITGHFRLTAALVARLAGAVQR
ncbi:MAG: DUF1287 domain-containing protein [Gemmobacter sp.]|uniref:DUF1287 domain-containing protein n=1 Tax=Gemmobacter sp. TaxID=1898957 RepID=UPI001A364125|nr:DUF1287 domain-containing protein [Gemmobacter sp.]MBL8563346.1 DUF1287 domain-containing protein [Gemmobacter sp.]